MRLFVKLPLDLYLLVDVIFMIMDWSKEQFNVWRDQLINAIHDIKVSRRNPGRDDLIEIDFDEGVKYGVELIGTTSKRGGSLIFVGNGGCAAIASHQAMDFLKTCGIRAYAPLDHSLLTCMSADFGYENVFSSSLDILARKEDVLIAIASSGQSKNILNAVLKMKGKGLTVITSSGFKPDNPLRQLGDLNFYVPSESYYHVENAHLYVCNSLLSFTEKSIKGK